MYHIREVPELEMPTLNEKRLMSYPTTVLSSGRSLVVSMRVLGQTPSGAYVLDVASDPDTPADDLDLPGTVRTEGLAGHIKRCRFRGLKRKHRDCHDCCHDEHGEIAHRWMSE